MSQNFRSNGMNYTSYGLNEPAPVDHSFLGRLSSLMPAIVGGIFTAGAFGGGGGAAGALGNGVNDTVDGLMSGSAAGGSGVASKFGLGALANFFNSRGGAGLVDAASGLIGTKLQTNAAGRASDIQAQAARDALAWEEQQYANAQRAYQSWQGGPSVTRIADLLGMSPGAGPAGAAVANMLPAGASAPVPVGAGQTTSAAAANPGSMVTLRSPDGAETRSFQANDPAIAKHLARGAVRVG